MTKAKVVGNGLTKNISSPQKNRNLKEKKFFLEKQLFWPKIEKFCKKNFVVVSKTPKISTIVFLTIDLYNKSVKILFPTKFQKKLWWFQISLENSILFLVQIRMAEKFFFLHYNLIVTTSHLYVEGGPPYSNPQTFLYYSTTLYSSYIIVI